MALTPKERFHRLFQSGLAFCLIFVVALFIAHPAYHGGLFQAHDDVQVTRIQAMAEELRGGQFPVRYIDAFGNNGGYFLFNFYSPLVYYLGALAVLIGFSAITAVKILYLVIIAVGILGLFILLKSKTSLVAATVGTIVFLFSPYVFHDLFHRGALPEATALMLAPWVLWAFLRLKHTTDKTAFVVGVLSFSGVVLSHVLTGALLGGLLLVWAWPLPPRKNLILYSAAVLLALAVAGFYFLPALWENQFTRYQSSDLIVSGYQGQFVQLWEQFGTRQNIQAKGAFLGAGLMISLGVITAALFARKVKTPDHTSLLRTITGVAVVALWFMTPWSAWFWDKVIFIRYLQFPYRFLTILTVVLTLGLALVYDQIKRKTLRILLLGVVLIVPTMVYWPYYQALGYQYVEQYQVEGSCRTTAWDDEHLPQWVNECLPQNSASPLAASLTEGLAIANITVSPTGRHISFVPRGQGGQVQISKYYFPGWQAKTEDEYFTITPTDQQGLISFVVPESAIGEVVTVKLNSTPIRQIGNLISVLAIIALLVIGIGWKRA